MCIDHCKPIVGAGAPCTVDLCADGGSVCDRNLACAPNAAGAFVCQGGDSDCDPQLSAVQNHCPAGSFCMRLGLPTEVGADRACAPPRGFADRNGNPIFAGVCFPPVAEGETCDSDVGTAQQVAPGNDAHCLPCEPGTTCVKPVGSATGTCRRACDPARPDAACGCPGYSCLMSSAGESPGGSYCAPCAETGMSCRTTGGGTLPCCSTTVTCGANLACCNPTGASCTTSADCCRATGASVSCTAGRCAFACTAGHGDCDGNPANGCEADLRSAAHCGRCGNRCPAVPGGTATCSSGTCGGSCPSGLTLCGGRCVNLRTDPANCAGCGRTCPVPPGATAAACVASACTGSCSGGREYCGTSCVDTSSDRNHCGGCGRDCPSPRPCVGGACESCEVIRALVGQATHRCTSRDPGLPEPCCIVDYPDGPDVTGRCVTLPGQMAPFGSCIR